MKTLPAEFRSDHFQFLQIAREGDIALFRKTKGKIETFEVVIIQHSPEKETPWGHAQESERMPSNEQWGSCGWSLQTLERAWEKFRSLRRDEG